MTVMTGELLNELAIIKFGVDHKVDDGVIPSYGMDGCLYTFRADPNYFPDHFMWALDPFQSISFPTLEHVRMPSDMCGTLTMKSTYSRKGVILVTNSPVDPGYEGPLTIGMFNSGQNRVYLQLVGGLMQMMVHMMASASQMGYKGRWQGGKGVMD